MNRPVATLLIGFVLGLSALGLLPGTAMAACTAPNGAAGEVVYNETEKLFQYCDDTNWVRMNQQPGTGAGG